MAESLMARVEEIEKLVTECNEPRILINVLRDLIPEYKAAISILSNTKTAYATPRDLREVQRWLERNGVKRGG